MLVKDLEQKMNEEFVCKEWSVSRAKWDFLEFIKEVLTYNGLGDVANNLTLGTCERQEIAINYKGRLFLYINVSKKKGNYKGYWQGTYEWHISNILINEWSWKNKEEGLTIEERVELAEKLISKEEEKKKSELQTLLPIFEEILKVADGNIFLAQSYIKDLNNKFYELVRTSQGDK